MLIRLKRTVGTLLAVLAASLLLLVNLPYLEGFRPSAAEHHAARATAAASDWRGFSVAATAGTLRTGSLFAFQAFVPLYVWRTLDSSEGTGNIAIAAMLAAGAFGTLLGGRLSDLHGFRRVVIGSLFAAAPLALFIPVLPLLALIPVIALFGLISEMNFYPLVVIAHRTLPRNVGFASGVMLGLSIGIGSLASPLLGVLADSTSLRTALVGAGVLAVLAALTSLLLPQEST